MTLSLDSLMWSVSCGLGAALYAALIGGPIFGIVMFFPGALIGLWAEQSRYRAFR